ncbi:MAG: PH domain-containing protein [Nocardioidaceae bacterium]|nr:MAG: PH domain-containing protein [Nocardioidaceae bacterium]
MPPGSDRAAVPDLPVRFRPLGVRIALIVGGVLLIVLIAVMWFALPQGMRDRFTLFQGITLLLMAGLIFALMYGVARCRIDARTDGITVINGYRARTFAWSQVLGVHLPAGAPWARLDLSDGTTLAAVGIQGSDGPRAHAQVRQLRALIEKHGQATAE